MIENSLVVFLNTNGVLLLVAACFGLLSLRKSDREVRTHAVLVFVITVVVSILLKELFDRPRPYEAMGVSPLAGLDLFPSFPSAHAAMSFAVSTTVALHRRRIGIFFLILSTLISVGRVVALVHYPSDIVVGILVGVMVALFFDTFHVRVIKKRLTR